SVEVTITQVELRKIFNVQKKDTRKPITPSNKKEELFSIQYKKRRQYAESKAKLFEDDQKFFDVVQRHKANADLYIIGSDEVWNIKNKKMNESLYWNLDDLNPVISYATSIGGAPIDEFQQYEDLISSVNHLDQVLVRDKRTEEFVRIYTKQNPTIVCDPSLLIPVEEYGKDFKDAYISKHKCMLVYGYAKTFDKDLQNRIKRAAKVLGVKTVGCCFYQPWCDYNVNCSPLQFSSLIRQCAYVLTTTFHGSIFSALNHSNFICLPASIKSNEIMERFDIHNRILDLKTAKPQEIVNAFQGDMYDCDNLNKRILEMRKSSDRILRTVLDAYSSSSVQKELQYNCCGCGACASICPTGAITMHKNIQGFMIPLINQKACTECRMCINNCAFAKSHQDYMSKAETKKPKAIILKHKKEDIRMASRSGGAFTAISDRVLEQDGMVYGCGLLNNRTAKHLRATTKEERNFFRGSKYIESDMADVFENIEKDILSGKPVLFSGTPCQVDAIKMYLTFKEKDLNNLLLVDIVCHGVPSPRVWSDYLDYVADINKNEIASVDFRDKVNYSWSSHKESFHFTDGSIKTYQIFKKLFYDHMILRESCFKCPYKKLSRPGDITLADAWGAPELYPEFCDEKGISLVLINTDKGGEYLSNSLDDIQHIEVDISCLMQASLRKNYQLPENYDDFWGYYVNNKFKDTLYQFGYKKRKTKKKASLIRRIGRKFVRIIRY
ncbi:MAG: Coenzyme F420 hydrogenase/dehydrogenase, beta subunit C-terminal domain, partial [Bacillota bacterium]|nr:Coenzyme F420 hydrogenase/dehydrogenase, beta subunit C-terminal domain [Bacillota bacterium]